MKLLTTILTIVLVVVNNPMGAIELLPKGGYSKSDCKGFHTHELLEPYTVKIDTFKTSTKWVDPQFENSRTEGNIVHEQRSQNDQRSQSEQGQQEEQGQPEEQGQQDEQGQADEPAQIEEEDFQIPLSKSLVSSNQQKILVVYEGTVAFEDRVEDIRATREMSYSTQTRYAPLGLAIPIYQRLSHSPFKFLKRHQDIEMANAIEKIELVVNKNGVLHDRPAASKRLKFQRVRVQPVSLCITFDVTKLGERRTSATKQSFAFQQFDGFRVAKERKNENASTSESEAPDAP
ncbi:MAG: hypothetical protein F4227_08690 [Gammaproteobacteria bacterium]|nr:hypothetical protein [Gammaproteobacteria bacterium]MYF03026.1 hypothetical protein [Gammaproteobacteria bacterium]